jgi:hypothetical protein
MSQASLSYQSLRARLPTNTKAYFRGGAVLVVLIIAACWLVLAKVGRAGSTAVPTSPAIEAKWGVRVTQIGVTADGGMADLRFIVLDPDKAVTMMQSVNNLPVLVAEDSGTVINSSVAMAAKHDMNPGQTYFLLYRNTEGAVRHGTSVTVRFGDLELQHVIAK